MGRCAELEAFRLKLWDRYTKICGLYNEVDVSFDDIWFDFLSRHIVLELPLPKIFEQICREMTDRVKEKPGIMKGIVDDPV